MPVKPIEKHRGHPKKFVEGPFGPHAGKMVCARCGVFVKWVTKDNLEMNKKPLVSQSLL